MGLVGRAILEARRKCQAATPSYSRSREASDSPLTFPLRRVRASGGGIAPGVSRLQAFGPSHTRAANKGGGKLMTTGDPGPLYGCREMVYANSASLSSIGKRLACIIYQRKRMRSIAMRSLGPSPSTTTARNVRPSKESRMGCAIWNTVR